MKKEEYKYLAMLVSRDIHRYKQEKDKLTEEVYEEHHSNLVILLDKLKVMANQKG